MKYIENNPVRSGIAKNAENYNWSSAKRNLTGEIKNNDLVSKDSPIASPNDAKKYRKYFYQIDKDDETNTTIRKNTASGRPIGKQEFLWTLGKLLEREIIPKKVGRPRVENNMGSVPD